MRHRGVLWPALLEVRSYWRHFGAVFALELLATPLLLLSPVPLKIAVDSVLGDQPLPSVLQALLPAAATRSDGRLLVTAALLQVVFVLLAQFQALSVQVLRAVTAERMTLSVRAKLFRHAQELSFSFHDRRGTTDSIYRIQYDAESFEYATLDSLLPFGAALVSLVGTIWVVFRLNGELALVALAVTPFLFAFSGAYSRRVRPRYRHVMGIESGVMKVVQEVLTGLRVVKAFSREDAEKERFARQSAEAVQ
ncbi:MAG: ABC transporter ATP-binding protein, partial [Actinobacteria bacterium]|nr:ABC transporter ATP-binding protein [Actinomycetota bacterium]